MEKVICYTGGASRGNPGPAAVGVYITDAAGVMMSETAETIGNSTDVFAKYHAVLAGLQSLRTLLGNKTISADIEICLDSEFVKKQLNAELEIKEPGFVPMFIEIHNMRVASFPHLTFTLIPVDQNTESERLVKEALDSKS